MVDHGLAIIIIPLWTLQTVRLTVAHLKPTNMVI